MTERPILFTAQNAQQVHKGTKTQTRRLNGLEYVNNVPDAWDFLTLGDGGALFQNEHGAESQIIKCPYGTIGDQLWVRESIYIDHFDFFKGPLPKDKPDLDDGILIYRGDGTCCEQFSECNCAGQGTPWRPSIHMPKWACRTWLELIEVRIERLLDISNEDAEAEGCQSREGFEAFEVYAELWESIHGEGSWNTDPWVWVLGFKKLVP
ncbi:MAG: hypothetical protein KGL39_57520 [Patescibacteria group bacterium]|nr:hypothetical protein [Patescibacteria group bacterium]